MPLAVTLSHDFAEYDSPTPPKTLGSSGPMHPDASRSPSAEKLDSLYCARMLSYG